MGLNNNNYSQSRNMSTSSSAAERVFVYSNYMLLGAASSCIFLTLSLRLVPSLCGFSLILLHVITIASAITGCAAASSGEPKWYFLHMVATVLTAIFQGSVCVLIFTNTHNFLGSLKSYVREDDAGVILKMTGGLCALIFCLDWVTLALAFFSKFYAYVQHNNNNNNNNIQAGADEDTKNWPWPFQV